MKGLLSKLINKLYLKHWVIGICRGSIEDIIRKKAFENEIKWLRLNSIDHHNADPFLLRTADGSLNLFFEDYAINDFYGKIFLLTFDNAFNQINQKMLLDTKSHLSYPFIFKEDNKIYVFPEAAHSGKLTCYEYDPLSQTLTFAKEILNLALLDSTILKHDNKYWLFGTLAGKDSHSKLYVYISDNLLGPYSPHPANPVKSSSRSSRPAGNFIRVDGAIFRPSQNCEKIYGESITINKINTLNEFSFDEEEFMTISANRSNFNKKIRTIHTINVLEDIITIDGIKWTFSPKDQWKFFLQNRKYSKPIKKIQIKELSDQINQEGIS
jgi:hypothetical protein